MNTDTIDRMYAQGASNEDIDIILQRKSSVCAELETEDRETNTE